MTDAELRAAAPSEMTLDEAEIEALIVEIGLELLEHEVYLDLANPGHGPFRALPGQTAGSGNRYIAEAALDPTLWHALVRRDAAAAVTRDLTESPPLSL